MSRHRKDPVIQLYFFVVVAVMEINPFTAGESQMVALLLIFQRLLSSGGDFAVTAEVVL